MLGPLFESKAFKSLVARSEFVRWLEAARKLRQQMDAGHHPIYLDYPIRPRPRYGYGRPLHRQLFDVLERNQAVYERTIADFHKFAEPLGRIPVDRVATPLEPFWNNSWVEGMDCVALYSFPALLNSKLYLEIGSGNSTKFVRKSIRDNGLGTRIVSVDPHPRAEIDSLCDEVIRSPLENVDLMLFDRLQPGDILMIDNSHRCFQNSDVTVVFLEILPRLKSGVFVYIDDIYLPADYPPSWAERYYSEQYLLAVLLLADRGRYDVRLPCQFIEHHDHLRSVVESFWDKTGVATSARRYGNGFWMVVKE